VTQLVHDYDRAWHAGASGNPRGIGIECRPEMSAGDIATVKSLIAAIRAEWGNLPIRGHRDFMSTACPGRWYAILGQLGGGASTPASGSTSGKEKTATDGQLMLDIDGDPGGATYSRFQQVMGTPIDGVKSKPSEMIRAFQRWLNTVVSRKDIQNITGKPQLDVDGYDGWRTWKVFQYWAYNVRKDLCALYAPGWGIWDFADGDPGTRTWKVLQHILNESYAGSGKLLAR
jgi:hypothetical protein